MNTAQSQLVGGLLAIDAFVRLFAKLNDEERRDILEVLRDVRADDSVVVLDEVVQTISEVAFPDELIGKLRKCPATARVKGIR